MKDNFKLNHGFSPFLYLKLKYSNELTFLLVGSWVGLFGEIFGWVLVSFL